jgi:hypothetical protein
VDHLEFRKRVRNGDLLGTQASNNWMSRFHSFGLGTPIAHVGIAIVEQEGDALGKVYMFESGAPRGAQLRDLDDYMMEGAERLWWRPIDVDDTARKRIVSEIERAAHNAYSWSFLKQLPKELSGVEAPGLYDDLMEACSCADLIAKIYTRAEVMVQSSRTSWLPMHFLEQLPSKRAATFLDPVNVIFNTDLYEKRWRRAVEALAVTIKSEDECNISVGN